MQNIFEFIFMLNWLTFCAYMYIATGREVASLSEWSDPSQNA